MTKKPTQVFIALFPECFDVQIHLIKNKDSRWGKAREGNALSVQEQVFSAAMANFVPLSRTWSGPSIQLKTLWPGSTAGRLGLLHLLSLLHLTKAQLPLLQELVEYVATTLAASLHSNMVVCYRAQIASDGIEKSVGTGKCITSSPRAGQLWGLGNAAAPMQSWWLFGSSW